MKNSLKARCLCGAVQFQASPVSLEMGVCHCSMCRRWSGGVLMSVHCGEGVEFKKQDGLMVYNSSLWGERLFCKFCGSTLIWRTKERNSYMVSVQAFDDPSVFKFTHEIFMDEKPKNYSFSNKTKTMTGAEAFSMLVSPHKPSHKDCND